MKVFRKEFHRSLTQQAYISTIYFFIYLLHISSISACLFIHFVIPLFIFLIINFKLILLLYMFLFTVPLTTLQ